MTTHTAAVERAARELARGDGLAIPWQRFTQQAQEAITAALTDPDDPDSLARTLFTLTLLARDPGFTVEGAALVWREDIEVTRVHWRAVADGLRMMLTGHGS